MPLEKSAGVIIFRKIQSKTFGLLQDKENSKIYYLLLHYPGVSHRAERDYWDFPKGHIEKGEEDREAATREIKEETGLGDLKYIEGFKEMIKYFFSFKGEKIFKTVVFYLAETKTKKVKISPEHIGYKWLNFNKALEQLTFKNAKEILIKAQEFLFK